MDSTYDCKTQQNSTLTSQEEEGDVQLKVSYVCFVIFWLLDYFSSWDPEFRRLIPFCPCDINILTQTTSGPPLYVPTEDLAKVFGLMTWRYLVSLILVFNLSFIVESGLVNTALAAYVSIFRCLRPNPPNNAYVTGAPNDGFLQNTLKTLFRLSRVLLDL